MSQSLSQIYIHLVFRVKSNRVKIAKEDKSDLFRYISGAIKNTGSIPIKVNGMSDHVHVLCSMSKNISLAKLAEEVKRSSSRWIKTRGKRYHSFAWQGGYAGFSVSPSVLDRTIAYIEQQEEHHSKKVYRDEVSTFLKIYQVEYDEKYFFEE